MRCLTIRQPWAELIVRGRKRVENRSWRTTHRGPLAIHAGLSRRWYAENPPLLRPKGIRFPAEESVAFGAILGIVDVVDCVPIEDWRARCPGDPFAKGPCCWVLRNPRRLKKPVIYTGQRRMFDLPAGLRLSV